jgi:hypothetical protein
MVVVGPKSVEQLTDLAAAVGRADSQVPQQDSLIK